MEVIANLWTVEDVCKWLKNISISDEIISIFKENEITGKALLSLTQDELKELGVKQLGPKKHIAEEIENLKKGKEIKNWSVDEVCSWVSSLSLSKEVVDNFKDGGIDGKTLLALTPQEIKEDLGVKTFGARRVIQISIESLKSEKKEEKKETSTEKIEVKKRNQKCSWVEWSSNNWKCSRLLVWS